jgi:hypothetical protein
MTLTPLTELVEQMRKEADECRQRVGGCQSEYAWHASMYARWADELDSTLRALEAQTAERCAACGPECSR